MKHPNYLVSQLSSNSGTGRQSLQTGRTVLPSVRTSSAREAPQVYYYHCDPVGLPLALSDEDGAVRWAAHQTPGATLKKRLTPTLNTLSRCCACRGSSTIKQPACTITGIASTTPGWALISVRIRSDSRAELISPFMSKIRCSGGIRGD